MVFDKIIQGCIHRISAKWTGRNAPDVGISFDMLTRFPLSTRDKFEFDDLGPILLTWFNFNPSMDNCIHYKVWDEITYPFLNFNGPTVEV